MCTIIRQPHTSTLNRNSLCTYFQPSLLSRQHAPIKPTITSLEKHQHNIPPPLSRARSSGHQEDAQTPYHPLSSVGNSWLQPLPLSSLEARARRLFPCHQALRLPSRHRHRPYRNRPRLGVEQRVTSSWANAKADKDLMRKPKGTGSNRKIIIEDLRERHA
jgi:hypothetical protein